MTDLLIPGQHIHIVGVGGSGMSAIARILLENGYTISGSDQKTNPLSELLKKSGATIYDHHAATHVTGAELILMSSAIPESNPEIQAARSAGIPVLSRREIMSAIMEGHQTLAVAGTHGKTTTTSMLTHVLMKAGFDPSYIVGGVMKNTGTNAGAGQGEHFVIEADEYGHMFMGLKPEIALITNIEYDHPDYFLTPGDLLDAFRQFVGLLPREGLLVGCAEDDVVRTLVEERRSKLMPAGTYAIEDNEADWWAIELKPGDIGGMDFTVCHGAGTMGVIGQARLQVPGRHNVQNAMGVIAIARHLGIPFETIIDALGSFTGTERRAELMGQAGGVTVINDYAHHPTAIRAVLDTVKLQYQNKIRHLWAVWQPHTYSRTKALAESFQRAFPAANHVLVTDIFAAREGPLPGVSAKEVVKLIQEEGHPDARHSGDLLETAQILAEEVQSGDVVVLLTAGDAPQIGRALLDVLKNREKSADSGN